MNRTWIKGYNLFILQLFYIPIKYLFFIVAFVSERWVGSRSSWVCAYTHILFESNQKSAQGVSRVSFSICSLDLDFMRAHFPCALVSWTFSKSTFYQWWWVNLTFLSSMCTVFLMFVYCIHEHSTWSGNRPVTCKSLEILLMVSYSWCHDLVLWLLVVAC